MTITRRTTKEWLRRFCIKYDLCTKMDNETYDKMLENYSNRTITDDTAIALAYFLMRYSETDLDLRDLVAGIVNDACYSYVTE